VLRLIDGWLACKCVVCFAAMASLGGRKSSGAFWRLVSYRPLARPPRRPALLASYAGCARLAELCSTRAVVSNARKGSTQRARSLH
jgi:hypothetical protein